MAVKIVGWKSWYTNNPEKSGFKVYSSGKDELKSWKDLPEDGHQATVIYVSKDGGPITRQVLDGYIYIFRWSGPDGVTFGISNENKEKILIRYPGAIIKQGRTVTLEILRQIDDELMAAKLPCDTCKDT